MYKDGSLLAALEEVARDQFQLVTRRQALTILSSDQLDRLRRAGLLRTMYTGVYALAGAQSSWRQRAMGACLSFGPPVGLAGLAAAHLWELDDGLAPALEVIVPRNRNGRRQGVLAHRGGLLDGDLVERFGVPVTAPARTILDLSLRVPEVQLDRYLGRALREHRLSVQDLRQRLDCQGDDQGRYRVVRTLLEERGDNYRPGESHAEDELYLRIVKAGLPAPARQAEVSVGRRLYRLDLAYVEEKVAIEYDSFRYHGGAMSFHADRQRAAELQLEGWLVLQVTARHDQHSVVEWIRRALRSRSAA